MVRLRGQERLDGGELCVGGSLLHTRSRRLRDATWVLMVVEDKDPPDLAQGDVIDPAREVASGRVQETRKQRGAQKRLLLGQGVGEPRSAAPTLASCDQQRIEITLPHEGVSEHIDDAGGRQRQAGTTAQPLLARKPIARGRLRQPRRDAVIADESHDLFDQIGRIGEVRAPRRRGHLEDSVARDLAANLLQVVDHGGSIDGHPRRALRQVRIHRNDRR